MWLDPEDRKPGDAPCFPEPQGTRWELPVVVNGLLGTLVLRTVDGADGAVTVEGRGTAADLMEILNRLGILRRQKRRRRRYDP